MNKWQERLMSIIKCIVAVLLVFSLTGCLHHHGGHNGVHRTKAHRINAHKVVHQKVWIAGHWKRGGGKRIWVVGRWK